MGAGAQAGRRAQDREAAADEAGAEGKAGRVKVSRPERNLREGNLPERNLVDPQPPRRMRTRRQQLRKPRWVRPLAQDSKTRKSPRLRTARTLSLRRRPRRAMLWAPAVPRMPIKRF